MQTFNLETSEMAQLKTKKRAHLTFITSRYWANVLSQIDERFQTLLVSQQPFNISHLKSPLVLDCVAYGINEMPCQHQRAHVVQMGLEVFQSLPTQKILRFYLDLEVLPDDEEN